MPRTRIVAVLFTDVVGSTELLSRVGPYAADELRDRHFAEMRSALAVHRGTEVKTLGDGMMAVFESATDAIACAVTMQQAAAAQGRRDPDARQDIRIGLSVGEATVEERRLLRRFPSSRRAGCVPPPIPARSWWPT